MKRAIWRRDDVLMTYDPMFPASRVQEADRESYTCSFTTHFTQAAVEALRVPGDVDVVRASLGLLNGFPRYLALAKVDDAEYELCLYSNFLRRNEAGLDTPAGVALDNQADDCERGFELTVVRGSVGAIDLTPGETYATAVKGADPILCSSSDGLVYDADGNLKVELELKVCQHKMSNKMRF